MDIEKLIEQGRRGDETALRGLYRTYYQRMARICQRIVGDRRVAEELSHDAFLLAFAKMDSLRNPRRFESWLTSITTNVALRYKQRHQEPTMLSLSTLTEEELAQETMPEDDKPLPTMAELMEAVNALPKGYGQVFRLAVIEEMSHKEIAEIMGIATHSSSSQLARAKKVLQKSLAHYWLLWLLPLLLPITYFFLQTDNLPEKHKPVVTKQDELTESPIKKSVIPDTQREKTHRQARVSIVRKKTDSIALTDTIRIDIVPRDTTIIIQDEKPQPDPDHKKDTYIADLLPEKPIEVKDKQKRWSMDLSYNGSMGEQNVNHPFVFTETEMIDVTSDVPPVRSFDKWSEYAEALKSGIYEGDYMTQQILMKIALNNAALPGSDIIERMTHHYIPITFSLALKYRLNNRFGWEAGLSYSRLKSESEIGANGNSIREQQTIHYLGIPLKGSYNIYNVRRWNLYGNLGVKMEIPVYAPLNTNYYINGTMELSNKSTLHAPLQWSFGTGLGLQYNLTPNIGFFAEPSLQYYFPTGSSIETYHTEHPCVFSLPLGIRLTW
ncbi:MAG: sigma-70 family RNA polymerase sigma factor [Bacteroidaceae bacterium]|nr:sigma-70 family RNA polymerase sigma factor [Bacteroidaceae bacterium]